MPGNTHGHPSTQQSGHTVITVSAIPGATAVVTSHGVPPHHHGHHHHHGHQGVPTYAGPTYTTVPVHTPSVTMPYYSNPNPYAGLMFAPPPVHGHPHVPTHGHGHTHHHGQAQTHHEHDHSHSHGHPGPFG